MDPIFYLITGTGLLLFALLLLWISGNKPSFIPDFPSNIIRAAKTQTLDFFIQKPKKRTKLTRDQERASQEGYTPPEMKRDVKTGNLIPIRFESDTFRYKPKFKGNRLKKPYVSLIAGTDPNWENYSTLGKQRAITEEANRRLNPRHISVQFKHDLKKSYDMINEQKRAGGMVRIPDLWREMKDAGYSRTEFERELFRLEKERTIEMQTASQPQFIPEYDRKLGIPLPRRGHLNYVVFRYDPRKPTRR